MVRTRSQRAANLLRLPTDVLFKIASHVVAPGLVVAASKNLEARTAFRKGTDAAERSRFGGSASRYARRNRSCGRGIGSMCTMTTSSLVLRLGVPLRWASYYAIARPIPTPRRLGTVGSSFMDALIFLLRGWFLQ